LKGLGAFAGMVALPAAFAFLCLSVLRVSGILPSAWTAHPGWPLTGIWLLVLSSFAIVVHLAARRLPPPAVAAGVWVGWPVLALGGGGGARGVRFLLLVAVGGATLPLALDPERAPALAAPVVAAFLWLPITWRLWDVFGWRGVPQIAALLAFASTPLAPFA